MNSSRWFAAALFIIPLSPLAAGWHDRKAEGWAWYEDRNVPEKEEKKAEEPPKKSAAQILGEARQELEESLATAILNPSEENVKNYLVMQKIWLEKSSKFSDVWARALLTNPQLDATIENPATQYGRQIAKQLEYEAKVNRIKELAKSHSLIFFYEGTNKVSQAFSVIVKNFSEKYAWEVAGIACDGQLLEGFARNQVDRGISVHFGITTCPALYAVTLQTNEARPIAYGLSSLDQIESNLILTFKENHGDEE